MSPSTHIPLVSVLRPRVIYLFVGPENQELTATQSLILIQTLRRLKEAVSRYGQEHKDLHSTVSKVGKSVDRVFKDSLVIHIDSWNSQNRKKYL